MYRKYIKRMIDITGASLGLLLTSPVLLIVGICLFFVNDGKPFFYQSRPGKNGKLFRIIKFKTMNDKRDENGKLLSNRERTHRLGRLLRTMSIDELPQMINVLLGHMSFIGPRPLLEEYLSVYSPEQARRHDVRPGITGWAQVNGRNNLSWPQKLEHDVWYVDHVSLSFDLKIIWMTIQKVLRHEGVNTNENTTMNSFEIYCSQLKSNKENNGI